MKSVSDEQVRARRRTMVELWTERVWPALAGALTAVGMCGMASIGGWLALGLVYVCTALFVGLVVCATISENGVDPARATQIGCTSSLVLVVMLGVALVFPPGGLAVAAAVAVTSPPVISRLGRLVPSRLHHASDSPVEITPDQKAVDAAFDEIVSGLLSEQLEDGPDGS
jgi:hypothetical protein